MKQEEKLPLVVFDEHQIRRHFRKAMKTGEFDLFGGTVNRSANCGFAVLPEVLEVPLPGCGKEIRAASFFINSKPIKVEIE